MTPIQQAQLRFVNDRINAIPYNETSGPTEPPEWYGDVPVEGQSWVCRHYVQAKATMLREQYGYSGLWLTEILCWTETNERHAVLRVLVDGTEPWILDSRFNGEAGVYPFSAPPDGYRWEAAQIAGTEQWREIV